MVGIQGGVSFPLFNNPVQPSNYFPSFRRDHVIWYLKKKNKNKAET